MISTLFGGSKPDHSPVIAERNYLLEVVAAARNFVEYDLALASDSPSSDDFVCRDQAKQEMIDMLSTDGVLLNDAELETHISLMAKESGSFSLEDA